MNYRSCDDNSSWLYDADEHMLWLLVIEWMNNTKSVDAKIQLKLFLNNTESDDIKLLLSFSSPKIGKPPNQSEYSNQTSTSFDHFGSVIVNNTYIISDMPADFS